MGKRKAEEGKVKLMENVTVHPAAVVEQGATIGPGTKVWAFAQVGRNAIIGSNCVLGNGSYVDRSAKIGNNVKVMNKAQVFRGCEIGNDVFIGPGAVIANDKKPKFDIERKFEGYEWKIGDGASIGANTVILPDVNIGSFSLVGAGSVVTKDVPAHGMVYGNPAKLRGYVCKCREKLKLVEKAEEFAVLQCPSCKQGLQVPINLFNEIVE